MDGKVLELFKSVTESPEPIDDIHHARPSFYITPNHVQVSQRTRKVPTLFASTQMSLVSSDSNKKVETAVNR